MKVFIETERLILRELLSIDDTGIFELDSDPEVHQFLGNQPIESIEEARKVIEFIRNQYLENGIGRWAVIEKQHNTFIGWGGFKLVKEETNNHIDYHDLGYRLIKRYWGKGFAAELAQACVIYGFKDLNLSEIYAITDVNNTKSRKVLEKAGLKYQEHFILDQLPHLWYKISNPDQ